MFRSRDEAVLQAAVARDAFLVGARVEETDVLGRRLALNLRRENRIGVLLVIVVVVRIAC